MKPRLFLFFFHSVAHSIYTLCCSLSSSLCFSLCFLTLFPHYAPPRDVSMTNLTGPLPDSLASLRRAVPRSARRGGAPSPPPRRKSQGTSHKAQVTRHKSQVTVPLCH